MGIPITKTVTLAWDGVAWYDKETQTKVTGVLPPYPMDSAEYSGECVVAPDPYNPGKFRNVSKPVQIVDDHPFDKSSSVTYEQAQKMIDDTIKQRSVPKQLMYFVEGDWLITYAYYRETAQSLSREINRLERRIECLERPWWRRWFH